MQILFMSVYPEGHWLIHCALYNIFGAKQLTHSFGFTHDKHEVAHAAHYLKFVIYVPLGHCWTHWLVNKFRKYPDIHWEQFELTPHNLQNWLQGKHLPPEGKVLYGQSVTHCPDIKNEPEAQVWHYKIFKHDWQFVEQFRQVLESTSA